MIRWLVLLLIVSIGAVATISMYLGPDDLSHCEATPSSDCLPADAIVAVSGGDTPARTAEAIRLYKQGWADKLVFSGAALDKSGPSNAAAMKQQALAAGVGEAAIIIEEQSETTKQNAQETRALLEANGVKSIVLVTSAYHQRRASLEFEQRLGADYSIRNHPVSQDGQWSSVWWATPSGWYLAVSELGKIVAFYLGGSK